MKTLITLVTLFFFTNSITYAQEKPEEDMVYVFVQKKAEYPGGVSTLNKFIKENSYYPYKGQEKQIEGKVYISLS